jgi:methyl-accepting chemotaxis protein
VNIFELISGTISMLAIIPLGYIAVQSMRESRDLRRIQEELTVLVRDTKEISQDVQRLQRELRTEQDAARVGIDETQRTVEHVTAIVERTAEQVTDVAADTLAIAAASPDVATAVTSAEQQDTRSRRARHLARLQRRASAHARRDGE